METKNIIILLTSLFAGCYMYYGQTVTIAASVGLLLVVVIYNLPRGEANKTTKKKKEVLSPKRDTSIKQLRTPKTVKRAPDAMSRKLESKIKEVGKRFDPTKSTVSTETMVDFLDDPRRSKDMEFEDFPGIGPKFARALRADGINNPMELVRMFKRFNEESDRTGYNCNRLYDYFHSLPSRHPRILKGHANWHAPTFAVASYADERCSWYTYDANDKWLQTIKEEDDM